MLYREYNDPTNLLNRYADSGRFDEFVLMILESKQRRDNEKAELIVDDRLWLAFLLAHSEKTFAEFKAEVLGKPNTENKSVLADSGKKFGKEEQEQLLKSLFPSYNGAG